MSQELGAFLLDGSEEVEPWVEDRKVLMVPAVAPVRVPADPERVPADPLTHVWLFTHCQQKSWSPH